MDFRALSALLLLAACSESSTSATRADAGGGEASDAAEVCGPPPGAWVEGRDPPAYCVKQVTGSVTSGAGALADKVMTVCGPACFYGFTDGSGSFRVRVNARLPDGQYTFFAHGRPTHASLYVPMPNAPSEQVSLPPFDLPVLSAEGTSLPPDDLPTGATVRAGPIELGVPPGTTWELAFEDAADDAVGRLLRWVKVAPERAPEFARGAAIVYALAPFEAKPSKPVALHIDDAAGLVSGAAVEIVVMDGFVFGAPLNVSGRPKIAARGHVSADGKSVTTDPGEGLSLLTWIAIRAL